MTGLVTGKNRVKTVLSLSLIGSNTFILLFIYFHYYIIYFIIKTSNQYKKGVTSVISKL